MLWFGPTSFFNLHGRFYLALHEDDIAHRVAQSEFVKNYFVVSQSTSLMSSGSLHSFNPTLAEVYRFDCMTKNILRAHGDQCKVVFSTGKDVKLQVRLAFLLGCNMIMSHGIGHEAAFASLKPMHSLFLHLELDRPMMEYFHAVSKAKQNRWIDFSDWLRDFKNLPTSSDMDEYIHYAR